VADPVCQACGRAAPVQFTTATMPAGAPAGPAMVGPNGAPRGARIAPHPTLLRPPPPPAGGGAGPTPMRRGPVFPVGRVRNGSPGPAPPGPRAIPTLTPPLGGPQPPRGPVPATGAPGSQRPSPMPIVPPMAPPPMAPPPPTASAAPGAGDVTRLLPPPLPPEWSEALGLARGTRTAPTLDRRSSAALEPPVERRNAVALSLAGLFDDLEEPQQPPAGSSEQPASKPRSPEPWSFEDTNGEKAEEPAPRHRRAGLRGLVSPGGLVALAAVAGALYVVGYFVARNDAPKPPSTDQVTLTQSR